MRTNDEMPDYIEDMIEHERECETENCPLCQSAQNIYRLARNLIFSEVVYPDVTIGARGRQAEAAHTAAAGTFFTPRAA